MENNKDQLRKEYIKKWQENNKEKMRANSKKWRDNNKTGARIATLKSIFRALDTNKQQEVLNDLFKIFNKVDE